KLYFIENDSSLDTGFAIDIEKNVVYIDPRIGSHGLRRTNDDPDELQDTQKFIDLIEAYDVQNWKEHYSDGNDDEDGYGWQILLQYSDGSVEKHAGSGTDMQKITPENFNQFTEDLAEIVNKELAADK